MTAQTRPQNAIGAIVLVLVIFADIGLAVWYWNWKNSRPRRYSADGFDVSSTETSPIPPEPAPPYAPKASPAETETKPSTPDNAPADMPRRTPLGTAADIRARGNASLSKAAAAVCSLQRRRKYRQSPVIRRWTRDFLSHPDLRRINAAYWKNSDVKAFVLSTLKSPNFAKMLRSYASNPDVISFAKDMAASPEILAAGRILSEDRAVMAAAKDVTLPGLPSIGTLMAAGHGMSGQNQAQALEKLKNDPNFKRFLESQNIPPVALQGAQPDRRQ